MSTINNNGDNIGQQQQPNTIQQSIQLQQQQQNFQQPQAQLQTGQSNQQQLPLPSQLQMPNVQPNQQQQQLPLPSQLNSQQQPLPLPSQLQLQANHNVQQPLDAQQSLMLMQQQQLQQQQQMQYQSPNDQLRQNPPHLQHIQQAQQVPQFWNAGASFATSTMNGIVPNNIINTDADNDIIDLHDLKPRESCLDRGDYMKLSDDFEQVTNMNLIDDESCYSLMLYENVSKTPLLYRLLLKAMYKEKYAELFECYESLEYTIEFFLGTILATSEDNLKRLCALQSVRCSDTKFLKLRNRKAPVVNTRNTVKHPFLSTKIYTQFSTLFNIGRCVKYCIPSDFAILNSSIVLKDIVTFIKKGKIINKGIKVKFSRPVLCFVVPQKTNYEYLRIEFMQSLCELLAKMSGKSYIDDNLTLGAKKQMTINNLAGEKGVLYSEGKLDSEKNLYAVVCNTIQFSLHKNQRLSGKVFADFINYVPINNNEADEDLLKQSLNVSEEVEKRVELICSKYEHEKIHGPSSSNSNNNASSSTNATINNNDNPIQNGNIMEIEEPANRNNANNIDNARNVVVPNNDLNAQVGSSNGSANNPNIETDN